MSLADLLAGRTVQMGPQANAQVAPQATQLFAQQQQPTPEAIGAVMREPSTPEEFIQRQEGWRGFFQEIRNNPTLRNTLLLAGGELLRGPQYGENPGAVLGRALETGTLAHMRGKQMEAEAALRARQEDRADRGEDRADRSLEDTIRRTDSAIQNDEVSRRAAEQNILFSGQRQPLELQQLEQNIAGNQFQLDNQGRLLEDQLATSASVRNFNNARAEKARRPDVAGTGTPSKEMTLERLVRMRDQGASDSEVAATVLDMLAKGAPAGEKFDSVTFGKLLENVSPQDPLYDELITTARSRLGLGAKEAEENDSDPEVEVNGKKIRINQERFEADKKKADANGMFTSHGVQWRLK